MSVLELRQALDTYELALARSDDEYDALMVIAKAARELLADPTNVQALALARLMRDREPSAVHITPRPFDLPEGFVAVTFLASGFECGIAPTGEVSS